MNAKKWLSMVIIFVFGLCALSQAEPVLPLSQDYRLDVKTNQQVLGNGDVLALSVSLLNNDAKPAAFLFDSNTPILTQSSDEVLAGVMDDELVDVEIITPAQRLIGFAEIRPLNSTDANEAKHIRLPLFGGPLIAGHSTRIVSLANIYIVLPEPNLPDSNDVDGLAADQEVELVQAVGKYLAERPGLYVITCYVNTLADVNIAQAQTIIRIAYQRPGIVERTIRQIDRRTERMAKVDQETLRYSRQNNSILQQIVKFLRPNNAK